MLRSLRYESKHCLMMPSPMHTSLAYLADAPSASFKISRKLPEEGGDVSEVTMRAIARLRPGEDAAVAGHPEDTCTPDFWLDFPPDTVTTIIMQGW